jgi:hypothetical protein
MMLIACYAASPLIICKRSLALAIVASQSSRIQPPAAKASVGLGGARAAGFLVLAAIAIGPLGMRGWGTTARFGKVLLRFV